MKAIDKYSYNCGTIDCFNEMIYAGLKHISLSHPENSVEERDAYIEFSEEICKKYETAFYLENSILTTDLFPASMTENKFVIMYYRDKIFIEKYLNLKKQKQILIDTNEYKGDARYYIACEFGRILSYPDSSINEHIMKNSEKEPLAK